MIGIPSSDYVRISNLQVELNQAQSIHRGSSIKPQKHHHVHGEMNGQTRIHKIDVVTPTRK
jgi:hypothetical protein